MWVPPEDIDPVVLHAPTRKSVAVFGAVCVNDGRFTAEVANRFDAATFQHFLSVLLPRAGKKRMVVVLDNARWHHAKLLAPWLGKHRRRLRLEFLPPYSPELNSIERVWKLTRRLRTHNRYFASLEELTAVILEQFQTWHKSNDQLRRLCAIT